MPTATLNDPHRPAVKTHLAWSLATWVALMATAVYLLAQLAILITVAQEYQLTLGVTQISQGMVGQAEDLVLRQLALTVLLVPVTVVYVLGNVGWLVVTRRMVRQRGRVLRRWNFTIHVALLLAAVVWPFEEGPITDQGSWSAARAFGRVIDLRTIVFVTLQVLTAVAVPRSYRLSADR